MDKLYSDTVRLLLVIAPDVFKSDIFAMKGGTAINLFVRDMPRLSVDIDLVYKNWTTLPDDNSGSYRYHPQLKTSSRAPHLRITNF